MLNKLLKVFYIYCIVYTINSWISEIFPDQVGEFMDVMENYFYGNNEKVNSTGFIKI